MSFSAKKYENQEKKQFVVRSAQFFGEISSMPVKPSPKTFSWIIYFSLFFSMLRLAYNFFPWKPICSFKVPISMPFLALLIKPGTIWDLVAIFLSSPNLFRRFLLGTFRYSNLSTTETILSIFFESALRSLFTACTPLSRFFAGIKGVLFQCLPL